MREPPRLDYRGSRLRAAMDVMIVIATKFFITGRGKENRFDLYERL